MAAEGAALRPAWMHHTVSCGGTITEWTVSSPDDFPEHAALHEAVRELQRQVNAMKDLLEKNGGWWLRYSLTKYLRTR